MADWLKMTASDLGRRIGAGEIDPIELTEVYLAAINAHEFTDRIYARLTEDRARAEAAAASGRLYGPTREGFVRPNTITMGTAAAAAIWPGPVSLLSTNFALLSNVVSCGMFVLPQRSTTGTLHAAAIFSAICFSEAVPMTATCNR